MEKVGGRRSRSHSAPLLQMLGLGTVVLLEDKQALSPAPSPPPASAWMGQSFPSPASQVRDHRTWCGPSPGALPPDLGSLPAPGSNLPARPCAGPREKAALAQPEAAFDLSVRCVLPAVGGWPVTVPCRCWTAVHVELMGVTGFSHGHKGEGEEGRGCEPASTLCGRVCALCPEVSRPAGQPAWPTATSPSPSGSAHLTPSGRGPAALT